MIRIKQDPIEKLSKTSDGQLNVSTQFQNSPNLDSFSRLRVSNQFSLFDNKNIHDRNQNQWSEELNGVGASITHLPNESSVQLEVGTVSGEFAIRQSSRYISYIPGKSQLIIMTGVFGTGKTNVVSRLGYFDDDNGLFFEMSGTSFGLVRRTKASGSVVDNRTEQTDWNLDKLDGTGPSKIILDTTKTLIFVISYQWLGSGIVSFGFDIDGKIIYVHELRHSNKLTEVYMSTGSLPVRYEIRNTATSASSTTLKEICSSVVSEGAVLGLPGFEFTVSNKITTRAVTARTPILAVRLLNTIGSKDNRRTMRFVASNLYTSGQDACFEIAHLHNPSAITATWNPVGGGSGAEFSTDITLITGNPEHIINVIFIASNVGGKGATEVADLMFVNLHSFVSQNFDSTNSEVFLIYATPFTGTADVSSSLSWIEFD